MKRIGGLFDRIWDRKNLSRAYYLARRGKRQTHEAMRFGDNASANLNEISSQLKNGRYEFGHFTSFLVRDTKSRMIHAPSFQDRIVHHAIINVTGVAFERGAIFHSYACRKGRGQHRAISCAFHWTGRKDWFGKMDIRKFYDSIDHDILRERLARRFSENKLLYLFEKIIMSYRSGPGKGLPIGALTSQYLGNFYLDSFDWYVKASGLGRRYLRYMDDMVVWGTQDQLKNFRELAIPFLNKRKLSVKDNGQWNSCRLGVPFLGFVIFPDRVRLNRNGRKRLRRKLRQLKTEYPANQLESVEFQSRLTSLFAHAITADDRSWRNDLCKNLGLIDDSMDG